MTFDMSHGFAFDHCKNGHDTHQTKVVDFTLDISPKLKIENMKMKIYDWSAYSDETFSRYTQYCNGQDIISYKIDKEHLWEPYETAIIMDILSEKDEPGTFYDLGAHIGWYSTIGLKMGRHTISVDSDWENIKMVEDNAKLNGVEAHVHKEIINIDTLGEPREVPVHLLKVDIEGEEQHAFRQFERSFWSKTVKYALFEISPVFNDSYPKLCADIMDLGYDCYQIPTPGFHVQEFEDAPLATLKKYCKLERGTIEDYIKTLHQENMIFIRQDA